MTGFGLQDVVAILLSLVAAAYVLRILVGTMYGGGCSKCSHAEPGDHTKTAMDPPRKLKRLPLVTIDQIGRPYGDDSPSDSTDSSSSDD